MVHVNLHSIPMRIFFYIRINVCMKLQVVLAHREEGILHIHANMPLGGNILIWMCKSAGVLLSWCLSGVCSTEKMAEAFAYESSDIDWCEDNYKYSEHVVEYFNTVSLQKPTNAESKIFNPSRTSCMISLQLSTEVLFFFFRWAASFSSSSLLSCFTWCILTPNRGVWQFTSSGLWWFL